MSPSVERPALVFINGRFLTQPMTGVQRYATELTKAIDKLLQQGHAATSGLELVLLTPLGRRSTIALRRIAVREMGPLSGHAWEQWTLPRNTAGRLLVGFGNTGPVLKRRQVVTIHDASVFAVPESYTPAFRRWYRLLLPALGRVSDAVVTVSSFSQRELSRRIGIPSKKIRIVPNGVDHIVAALPDRGILIRHGLRPRGFILAVGSKATHKNVDILVQAIELVDRPDYDVVVAGGVNPRILAERRPELPSRVIHLGYVSDSELRALYESAACFAFTSMYEGFGLPPLEAMACGCPVVVSRTASLPEVCGDGALYADPRDPGDIARCIKEILDSPVLQRDLADRGLKRAARFTWERSACEVLALIRELLRLPKHV